MGHFLGFFEGARPFLPQNCPSLRPEQFRNHKGLCPLEKYLEMPHSMFCWREKNIISHTFRISGTLIVNVGERDIKLKFMCRPCCNKSSRSADKKCTRKIAI
jgi:hypothetical protein